MEVIQVATLVNTAARESIGLDDLVTEDLSNVVEAGKRIEDLSQADLDKYVHALPNVIGRMVFVNRPYTGRAPSLMVDAWEYGSIMSKVRGDLYDAQENESWELEDGASYDQGIFTKPKASVRIFNKMTTFEIPISITERQVKQSFHSAAELTAFISMIYTDIDNSITVALDNLIMRTLNNMTAETLYDELSSDYSKSGVRAVNLLALYNDAYSESLTADAAVKDPDFLRFASYTIGLVKDRMRSMSATFNIEGMKRHTPVDRMKTILLSDFAKAAEVYLYNNNGQFSSEYLALGQYETVPYWQGSGDSWDFDTVSAIDVVTTEGHSVAISGILGVVCDEYACLVCNKDRRTPVAPYNAKGEFWNYYHKWDCSYLNAFDENFVVFFVNAGE